MLLRAVPLSGGINSPGPAIPTPQPGDLEKAPPHEVVQCLVLGAVLSLGAEVGSTYSCVTFLSPHPTPRQQEAFLDQGVRAKTHPCNLSVGVWALIYTSYVESPLFNYLLGPFSGCFAFLELVFPLGQAWASPWHVSWPWAASVASFLAWLVAEEICHTHLPPCRVGPCGRTSATSLRLRDLPCLYGPPSCSKPALW